MDHIWRTASTLIWKMQRDGHCLEIFMWQVICLRIRARSSAIWPFPACHWIIGGSQQLKKACVEGSFDHSPHVLDTTNLFTWVGYSFIEIEKALLDIVTSWASIWCDVTVTLCFLWRRSRTVVFCALVYVRHITNCCVRHSVAVSCSSSLVEVIMLSTFTVCWIWSLVNEVKTRQ